MTTNKLSPAFDLPATLTLEAILGTEWAPVQLNGTVLVFAAEGGPVPRLADVRVRCAATQDSRMDAVQVAHRLRRMGWKKARVEEVGNG